MNVLYVWGYVKTFHCLSLMFCMSLGITFMTNNEMSLHTHRNTVRSWQTMKCLYIPRDIQYIHDKQWNVFTYLETYSTFMTINEMSLHTHRHTVHSWQTMKCIYIPRDIQYIHDKQWNDFTYPETCHECTVFLWVCKDI
jgi:hypothetical protein